MIFISTRIMKEYLMYNGLKDSRLHHCNVRETHKTDVFYKIKYLICNFRK